MSTQSNKIAIIFGGVSSEHDASLKAFDNIYSELVLDSCIELSSVYYVTPDGVVLVSAVNKRLNSNYYRTNGTEMNLYDALRAAKDNNEFVVNLWHGQFGEDGQISGFVNIVNGPRGSFGNILSNSIATSKYHMGEYTKTVNPKMHIPNTLRIGSLESDTINQIFDKFEGQEVVIKPNSLGASLFTEKLSCVAGNSKNIESLLTQIFKYDKFALVQQYIKGAEYSVGVIEEAPNHVFTLPIIKIDTEGDFFGHEEKHQNDKAEETIIRDDINTELTELLKEFSIELFVNLDFENQCRFDFIVDSKEQVYFLEANPLPGMMMKSIFPQMLAACNMEIVQFINILIRNAEFRRKLITTFRYDIL